MPDVVHETVHCFDRGFVDIRRAAKPANLFRRFKCKTFARFMFGLARFKTLLQARDVFDASQQLVWVHVKVSDRAVVASATVVEATVATVAAAIVTVVTLVVVAKARKLGGGGGGGDGGNGDGRDGGGSGGGGDGGGDMCHSRCRGKCFRYPHDKGLSEAGVRVCVKHAAAATFVCSMCPPPSAQVGSSVYRAGDCAGSLTIAAIANIAFVIAGRVMAGVAVAPVFWPVPFRGAKNVRVIVVCWLYPRDTFNRIVPWP